MIPWAGPNTMIYFHYTWKKNNYCRIHHLWIRQSVLNVDNVIVIAALLYNNLAMTSPYWCPPSRLCLLYLLTQASAWGHFRRVSHWPEWSHLKHTINTSLNIAQASDVWCKHVYSARKYNCSKWQTFQMCSRQRLKPWNLDRKSKVALMVQTNLF